MMLTSTAYFHYKWLLLILLPVLSADKCPRDRSRIVRMVISEKILPIFEEAGVAMPTTCPLVAMRDIYAEQEKQKTQEHPSRWTCGFCGKAFYEQQFLDKHFENKHSQFIGQGIDSVCLGDFCEIFRCEVVGKWKKAEYWDKALCKESRLVSVKKDCKRLMKQCTPNALRGFQAREFEDTLSREICQYLTCERYWEPLDIEMDPVKMAAYILACLILVFGLLIYYFVVYTHYYTEDPFFEHRRHRYYEHKNHSHLLVPENNEIRHRGGTR